jgi:YebC/PmpR family DNA-binding regulatory protein
MSGHSKWSTIKRKKAAVDAKRGKVFTKVLKEVTVAARLGGGDPEGNPRLRAAMQDARANNVPSDNIDRAVKKGTGELDGVAYEEVVYEGYAPGGVAVMVETMTDNRNRTVGEVRHVFTKYGGNLGQDGCVGYMFEKRGYFLIDAESMDEDAFMELALDLEVDDVSTGEEGYEIFTSPGDYLTVKQALADNDVKVAVGQLAMLPSNHVEPPADKVGTVMKLMEAMEDLDDVQNVWMNAQIDDSALEAEA